MAEHEHLTADINAVLTDPDGPCPDCVRLLVDRLRAERDEAHTQREAAVARLLNDLSRCREQHLRVKAERDAARAELDRLRGLAAECTCGTPGMDYDGPRPDCAVHGAVRAYHEAQAEADRLRDAVEHLTGVIADKNKEIQRLYAEFEQSALGDRIGELEADLFSIVRSLENGADEDALRTAKSALYGQGGDRG